MRKRPPPRLAAALMALAVVTVSCGGSDEPSSTDAAPTSDVAPTSDAAPTSDVAPTSDAPPGTEAPVGSEPDAAPDASPTFEGELVGLFAIESGDCSVAGSETGSFFRMVSIGGDATAGPFVPNGDSPCADQTFIPLLPGTDGGLITGTYQPGGDPAFDASGNATTDQIASPTPFFGVAFGMATTDEASATAPTIIATGGELSGDVAAVSAYYAGETFNQGSPKPDGSAPGATTPAPSGSIDVATGRYSLTWASQIVGGAFNDFTGVWQLQGTFTPAG